MKLLRFYNQNRGFIIAGVFIIALIIVIIQMLNSHVKERQEMAKNMINNSSTVDNSTTIDSGNTSIITGEEVKTNEQSKETIKRFVGYCNNKEIEKAYDMLSEDCRKLVYSDIEKFKTNYIDRIFYIYRLYTLENWFETNELKTYYIKYTEDILASGNANSKDNKGDYITVTKDNHININSFVGTEEINKENTKDGVTINVAKVYYYMDYTILSLDVKNDTDGVIALDSKANLKTTLIYDTNNVEYEAFLNEKAEEELQVRRNARRTINIKFNKIYNPNSRTLKRNFL